VEREEDDGAAIEDFRDRGELVSWDSLLTHIQPLLDRL
jgi:hypothetical protein